MVGPRPPFHDFRVPDDTDELLDELDALDDERVLDDDRRIASHWFDLDEAPDP